jgi:flagellar protein FlgJ
MKLTVDPSLLIGSSKTLAAPQENHPVEDARLKKTCQEFESILINSMFKGMRKTVPDGGLLEKGMGEETFEEMMDTKIAELASSRGGIGIGEVLYRKLLERQQPEE